MREDQIVSIAHLKEMSGRGPVRIDADIYIHGTVVSDDLAGNIYKSIVLEDATGGIEVKVDLEKIYTVAALGRGRTVIVRCNGLALGTYGGSLQVGQPSASAYQVDPIDAAQLFSYFIAPDDDQKEIRLHLLDRSTLSARYVNCYVRLAGVQFIDEEIPGTWGSKSQDADRHLVSPGCDTIVVRVSSRSALVTKPLPAGSGWVEGILGYFNDHYQLRPLNHYDNSMDGERFVPVEP